MFSLANLRLSIDPAVILRIALIAAGFIPGCLVGNWSAQAKNYNQGYRDRQDEVDREEREKWFPWFRNRFLRQDMVPGDPGYQADTDTSEG